MKTILITGASKGIGFQTALCLSEKPENKIIAVARSPKNLETLAREAKYNNIIPITFDLEKDDLNRLLEKIFRESPQIDVLINNAAVLINKLFEDLSIAEWKQIFEINLFSVVRLIQALKPHFNSEKAHIVNVSSMGGFQGSAKFNGLSAYSASKGALAILTECLASEFVKDRIAVNSVALGAVQTEMLAEAFPNYQAPVSAEDMGKFLANFAMEGNRYFNGKIIPVAFTTP